MSVQLAPAVDPVQVLFDLVATPSPSGHEHDAARVFARHGAALGFHAEIDAAGNAVASRGPADCQIHVVLLGHIDTVPGLIPVRVENGVLHGRGSVDAKGPLAAMLVAAACADVPAGVRLSVIGAVGEETPTSPGARFILGKIRPDACIIGEPSGWDGVTLGYKGRLIVDAFSEGENAHSSGPTPSACDDLHEWWARVLRATGEFNEGRVRAFDQIQATIQATRSSNDGLTRTATLQGGFRLPLGVDPDAFAEQLREIVKGPVRVECSAGEHAFATDRNDAVVRALSNSIRRSGGVPRPKLKTGTSDMNVVAPIWNCPIAAYGPGTSCSITRRWSGWISESSCGRPTCSPVRSLRLRLNLEIVRPVLAQPPHTRRPRDELAFQSRIASADSRTRHGGRSMPDI